MTQTLKKHERLKQKAQFRYVFSAPFVRKKSGIVLLARKNQVTYPRIGIIIPKKYIKKAHERHYFKRLIRESFRYKKHKLDNFDVIIIVKRRCIFHQKEKFFHLLAGLWKHLIKYSE